MKRNNFTRRKWTLAFLAFLLAVFLLPASGMGAGCAYVFETLGSSNYNLLLSSICGSVDQIPINSGNPLSDSIVNPYKLIILGDDISSWSSDDVSTVKTYGKSILAVGEGGERFLDAVPAWQMWALAYYLLIEPVGYPTNLHNIFLGPNPLNTYSSLTLYGSTTPAGAVGPTGTEYLQPLTVIGCAPTGYAGCPLVLANKYFLWGFRDLNSDLTLEGTQLYQNVGYFLYNHPDHDFDALTDYEEEVMTATDAWNPDTDGDGVPDLTDAFPNDASESADNLDAQEIQITHASSGPPFDSESMLSPSISGDRVAYVHYSLIGGTFATHIYDINLYDISADSDTQITSTVSNIIRQEPQISGNYVGWTDFRNVSSDQNLDIYLYDLATGLETQITTNTARQENPSISGNRIVWRDMRNGNSDIYMYDLSTGSETRITYDLSDQDWPKISGDRIIWRDYRGGTAQIYMYDISTDMETQITSTSAQLESWDISGDMIAYTVSDPILSYVYRRYIPTGTTAVIHSDNVGLGQVSISGDSRIVWTRDDDPGNSEYSIWMYDLGTTKQISTGISTALEPDIFRDRVVWRDNKSGELDIWMYAGDGIGDNSDNCPYVYNPDQADTDIDGIGDACDAPTTCTDSDSDGYGVCPTCGITNGCTYDGHDCVDTDSSVNPGAIEGPSQCYATCSDGKDNNCNSTIDEAPDCSPNCPDWDGDGYYTVPPWPCICFPPYDQEYRGDCNDWDANINPGITDFDNGLDDDCDGIIDNGLCSINNSDGDTLNDCDDNCPFITNEDQADFDTDGYGDACDDSDNDLIVDADDACPYDADNDIDGDGVCGDIDNCPGFPNTDQADADEDGVGDACEGTGEERPCRTDCDAIADADSDGLSDDADPCPNDSDCDDDGVLDASDNCIQTSNGPIAGTCVGGSNSGSLCSLNSQCPAGYCSLDQEDTDNDGQGDACDPDDDNDGVPDGTDKCPLIADASNADTDSDGFGNVCDPDDDNDGLSDVDEVAQGTSPTDSDTDDDGLNDLIDPYPLDPTNTPQYTVELTIVGTDTVLWTPILTWNPATEIWDPGVVTIEARLKDPGDNYVPFTGNVTFALSDVSRYAGIAMNDTEVCVGDCLYDYSLDLVARDMHTTIVPASNADSAAVQIYVFDFGGKARVRAATTVNGNAVEAVLKIPVDTDNDDLPNTWEIANGLNPNSPNQDDRWADIDTSAHNTYTGDGVINFAEWRGYIFDKKSVSGGQEIITGFHQQFSPTAKDLFVRGDGYKNSTECITTGALPASCIVPDLLDFAIGNIELETDFKNAFENAGIAVHDVTGCPSFSGLPGDAFAEPPFVDIIVVKNDTENTTTIVGSADGYINQITIRYWTWDTKGAAYYGDADNYHYWFNPNTNTVSRGAYTYHLNLMHYFYNRPYWDSKLSDGTYDANITYEDFLDPQSMVEDSKIEDGSLQITKKTATNEDNSPNNTKLKGDHVKLGKDPLNPSTTDPNYPNWKAHPYETGGYRTGYDFSTFDADGDRLVELPVVSDSKAIPKESTALHVQRQTIMHEMGHAAGIRNPEHPCETDNAMCVPVKNWDLAHTFSASGMSQIIIHNQ